MQDVLICDLFFPTGIKCKFSSFSASVPRRLCLIVNYSYSFALKTAAFQNVMKTPSPHSFLPSSSSTSNETLRLVCSPSLEMFLISSPLFIEPSSFPVSHESCLSSVYFSFSSLLNIHSSFFLLFLFYHCLLSFPFLSFAVTFDVA